MLTIERKKAILEKLIAEGKVIVRDVAEVDSVTGETIRRDLDNLEKEGLAKKTYGGAVKVENVNVELPYTVRKQTNVQGKKLIADKIGTLIKDGDYLLLDSSTTALFTVKSIASLHNITLLTNSIEVLLEMPQNSDWRVICTGGEFMQSSLSFAGRQVESIIDDYNVDLAVISCTGLDME